MYRVCAIKNFNRLLLLLFCWMFLFMNTSILWLFLILLSFKIRTMCRIQIFGQYSKKRKRKEEKRKRKKNRVMKEKIAYSLQTTSDRLRHETGIFGSIFKRKTHFSHCVCMLKYVLYGIIRCCWCCCCHCCCCCFLFEHSLRNECLLLDVGAI